MAGSFPAGLTVYTNPGPTTVTADEVGTRDHSEFHADNNDDLEAVMAKLGIGSSTASANTVLRGTGSGATAFGQIVAGDITNDTITATQLAADCIGTSELANSAVDTTNIVSGAVSQNNAVDMTASQTTTSTSPVNMTGSTINMTTTGGVVLLLATGTLRHSAASGIVLVILAIDGTEQGRYVSSLIWDNTDYAPFAVAMTATPSAASHAFTVQWFTLSGTATLNSGRFSVVEIKK